MKKVKILPLIICSLLITNCESIKKGLGIEKNSPDEFLVEKRQSITMPPDYNLLPPDYKKEDTKPSKEQNLKSILNNELNQKVENNLEIKENKSNKDKEIENKILNNIK